MLLPTSLLAGANEIAASAVGLVYLFAIGPTIIVKLTAPYWFHLVGYSTRFWAAAALMSCSFIIVGCSKSIAKQVRAIQMQTGVAPAGSWQLWVLHPACRMLCSGPAYLSLFHPQTSSKPGLSYKKRLTCATCNHL
jgi:hypothetical protein